MQVQQAEPGVMQAVLGALVGWPSGTSGGVQMLLIGSSTMPE